MKISFLIQDLFQQGAQYVTALMIRGFIDRGYMVDLIVSKVHQDLLEKGDLQPFELPSAVNIITLPNRKARKNITSIAKYIQKSRPNAIISMSSNYNLALALASLKLSRSTRRFCNIAYVEHLSFKEVNLVSKPLLIRRLFSKQEFINLIIKNSFDTIMAVSKGTAMAVEHKLNLRKNSVKVVYNPVIDNFFWIKQQKKPQHAWLINKSIPTIIAAGAHSPFKNHKILFEAIKLANEKTKVRLILFGKGELTTEYQNYIKMNNLEELISIAGHTDNLPAELNQADAFIISSDQESFSVVLVEALASNVPIISTNCPYGPPEILAKGKYGTLVPVSDATAMAEAIVNQINNPKAPAPKEAWERFTLEKIVYNYEKALNL